MTPHVRIVATGARTPLGLNAATSAAGYRAGLSAIGEHPFMIDAGGEPMSAALDGELDPGMMGASRLLALADAALEEACAPLEGSAAAGRLTLPIFVGLPE